MEPDLELVQVRDDQSFKIWSHGYPYRTVRWHFHPEYELHLITATTGQCFIGDHIGPFTTGDLVFVGPNLPHNWISDVLPDEVIDERCLVLQFTGELIHRCVDTFPELRSLRPILDESFRGVRFGIATVERVAPLMRDLLASSDVRRLALFIDILGLIGHADDHSLLASNSFRPNPSTYRSTAMNTVLQHIETNFTRDLAEADLAKLTRQSASSFSRSFRKHTGTTFVHYVNALRIELACQHLSQADLNIGDICFEVGFNNLSNFNRQFLMLKGMPPSKFRHLSRSRKHLASAA